MFVSEMVATRDVARTQATASTRQHDSTPQRPIDYYGILHSDNNQHAAILEQVDFRTRVGDDIGLFTAF